MKMIQTITINRERIQKEVDYWRIPGMALTLIQEGQPDQIACFGYRDVEKQLPVTPDTLFCVASCSKSMTAALIACLVDEGKLDWDVPVRPPRTSWSVEIILSTSSGLAICPFMPASSAAFTSSTFTSPPREKFRSAAPGFMRSSAEALIMPLVESIRGT